MIQEISFLSTLVVGVALYYIVTITYRLLFSPISHIPGPKLAAVTYFYQFYYDVFPHQGQFLFQCKRLHEQFGPIVRIGPDEVHVNDISFYTELYTNNARRRDKSTLWFWMVGSGESGDRSAFATLEHSLHRTRRNAFAPYFSKRKMQELEPRLVDKALLLRDTLLRRAKTGELVDLYNAFSALTLEVITEYAFGKSIPVLETADMGRPWNELLRDVVKLHPFARSFPFIARNLSKLPTWLIGGDMVESIKRFHSAVDDVTRTAYKNAVQNDLEVQKAERSRTTVLHEMVNSEALSPEEKTYDRVAADGMVFIGAGTETTGRTLAITFYHILTNPSIHARIVEELQTLMPTPDSSLPSVAALENLPYLTATISEGLRIAHGTAGRLARVAPDEDLVCSGIKIPRGTTISQSNYLIHVDPEAFPEPYEFQPERFIGANASRALKNFVPFGKGTRACVGINLAYAELYLTIAALLVGVKMELVETTKRDATISAEYFVGFLPSDSKGIRVRVLGKP